GQPNMEGALNHPVKLRGSQPCFTSMIGVAKSLPAGWVLRYSLAEATASFLSYVLEALPTQRKICNGRMC
uniref:Uncharacterized protein n=1 Tax=Gallus gallus TaxID=9031 RepID=A0A8V1AB56_CHICK